MTTPPVLAPVTTADEATKQAQLDAMKRRATGLLVLMAGTFGAARAFEGRWPWLGYVRATAEAAMVGGIADWFAVTALFRHPLGVPIPHTAIVPRRKDRIGRTLGGFVQNNFLSREVITARLGNVRVAERLAAWVSEPANARTVARHVARGMARAAQVLKDDDVQALIDRAIVKRVRATQAAPLLGKLLALITADNRHQELLDEALKLVSRFVAENEELIRERIRAESPWWVPEAVDERIHDKIVTAIDRTLQEVSTDPEHRLRHRFDDALHTFTERLRTSPEMIERAERIKEDMLEHPAVRSFSASLWSDVKRALLEHAERPETDTPGAVEQGLRSLGATVLADPALMEKLDRWVIDAAIALVEQYRGEVAQLISQTVGAWDPELTSRKIELQIGRDLQFIRINGTVVGGLVGLILYAISEAF